MTFVREVALGVGELASREIGVVGVGAWEVGEDAGAVDALPPERVVGELVDLVPADLLGEEVLHAGELGELGERAGVAERVGQPSSLASNAEFLLKVLLSINKLSRQRLSRWHVRVVLDPRTTDEVEFSFEYLLFNTFEKGWIKLLKPLVLLGLTTSEPMFWISVHEVDLGGPRTSDLLLGNTIRP